MSSSDMKNQHKKWRRKIVKNQHDKRKNEVKIPIKLQINEINK